MFVEIPYQTLIPFFHFHELALRSNEVLSIGNLTRVVRPPDGAASREENADLRIAAVLGSLSDRAWPVACDSLSLAIRAHIEVAAPGPPMSEVATSSEDS